jgi:hypothetical protein
LICRYYNKNKKNNKTVYYKLSFLLYQVYGEYVEDLEDDVDDIIRYFGKDFLIKPGKRISPLLVYGDSYGNIQNSVHLTY